jgi:hypothetical protein
MIKHVAPQSRSRRILYTLAAMALLVAGYAGIALTPASHARASGAGTQGIADVCPGITTHC